MLDTVFGAAAPTSPSAADSALFGGICVSVGCVAWHARIHAAALAGRILNIMRAVYAVRGAGCDCPMPIGDELVGSAWESA